MSRKSKKKPVTMSRKSKKQPVICAPCHQGRHSNKGWPEGGDLDYCPDSRCDCQCRKTAPSKSEEQS